MLVSVQSARSGWRKKGRKGKGKNWDSVAPKQWGAWNPGFMPRQWGDWRPGFKGGKGGFKGSGKGVGQVSGKGSTNGPEWSDSIDFNKLQLPTLASMFGQQAEDQLSAAWFQ